MCILSFKPASGRQTEPALPTPAPGEARVLRLCYLHTHTVPAPTASAPTEDVIFHPNTGVYKLDVFASFGDVGGMAGFVPVLFVL